MKLLLDIGNSSVNWVVQEQSEFSSGGAFSYNKNYLGQALQDNLDISVNPSVILVSNVAGTEVFNMLRDWIKEKWQLECWQPDVSASYKELKNSYSDIEQMGIDRWLAMVASWEEYHSALCLVGCGTALTIDLINVGGEHLGGYIVPGVELMKRALVRGTEQINVNIKNQLSLDYAKDTQSAINNGAFLAAVSMINQVTNKFSNESESEPKCIISGGMAQLIQPSLSHSFEYKPDLVLTGLSLLYKEVQ